MGNFLGTAAPAALAPHVYIDGAFDLTTSALLGLSQDAKLTVGVFPEDPDGRRLFMSHVQRVAAVRGCVGVTAVIADPPSVITDEFINQHKITAVLCLDAENPRFAAAKARGILKAIQKSDLTASVLIGHIRGESEIVAAEATEIAEPSAESEIVPAEPSAEASAEPSAEPSSEASAEPSAKPSATHQPELSLNDLCA